MKTGKHIRKITAILWLIISVAGWGCAVEEGVAQSDSKIQFEYDVILPMDFTSVDVENLVQKDLESGIARFLCSSAGSYDDMHVPGISQDELDMTLKQFDVDLVRFIWDGHEFTVTAEGGITNDRIETKVAIAEKYNQSLFRIINRYPEFRLNYESE